MQLFSLNQNILEPIKKRDFPLERDMQRLVERNLETLFSLEFIETEFAINNLRFDSIAFDNEINAFVIIEYKRGSSYSVIDQGFAYLSTLLNNKADFVLLLQEKTQKFLKKDDIDWSQTRVMFLADSFNYHQKNSINFKDLPIELWEIKQFTNNTITINQIRATQQTESIKTFEKSVEKNKIQKDFSGDWEFQENIVEKEIVTYTEQDHLKGKPEKIVELYEKLKEIIFELDENFEISPKKWYISNKLNKKNFVDFEVQKKDIKWTINLKKGTFTFHPDLLRDVSSIWKLWNWDYQFRLSSEEQLFEISQILREAYKIFNS